MVDIELHVRIPGPQVVVLVDVGRAIGTISHQNLVAPGEDGVHLIAHGGGVVVKVEVVDAGR